MATRSNQLWVADFPYAATWGGFVFVAFVVDVFARSIVGWRVSASMRTDFVLTRSSKRSTPAATTTHHSDQGVQYFFMRYTERLAAAGLPLSAGSRGDAYDNALAKSVIGLVTTEVNSVARRGRVRHARVRRLVR